ncbi:MAG TPA: peptidylprolyl isomerase [Bacteroidota bacterium]|nr:peptidylprolyl isomerase [Bacteroidota bacterium]
MKHVLLILLCTIAAAAAAPAQTLDRIVAVVNGEVILESELNAQAQFYALNNKMDLTTPGLRAQVLQSMINEKLIIAKAVEDSITVTDDEVQQQMDALIQQRVQQLGSESRLEEMYGMPLSRIKREFRDEVRKNLLAQKLQQQHLGNTSIGRFEVEDFYRTYRDSLPHVPEECELSEIGIAPRASDQARANTRARLQAILDSVRAGADFGDMARRYSQDPGSAAQGGDLGFVRRGMFVKEFESAAFSLSDGQISDIVETEHGLHIIQLLERRGDAVHCRHILLRIERTREADEAAIRLLDSLRARALAGESFAELARKYSELRDNTIGGNLGTVEIDQVNPAFRPAIDTLKEGNISAPVRVEEPSGYRYYLVWLRKLTPAHVMSLDQDYHKVEAIALNFKRTREYNAWMDDLKTQFYWKEQLTP